MRENKLRKMLRNNEPTIGTRIVNKWPGMMEIIGYCKEIDYVEFSAEYVSYNLEDLDNLARASEPYNISTMIKVDQSIQTFLAQRALGSGIQNILFTDIRTSEDVQYCVRAVRAETPETKGINPCVMRRNVGYLMEIGSPEYVQSLDEAVVAIMIEKKSAVENIEEILSVDGLDMVQFGPCDYAMSIGLPGQFKHPKVKEAEEKMIKAALKMGVIPRAEVLSIKEIDKYLDLGVRHFNIGMDIVVFYNWLQENASLLRKRL
jgi:2-keto-3-deoxy-L-rhamnonate aldolase RhmA